MTNMGRGMFDASIAKSVRRGEYATAHWRLRIQSTFDADVAAELLALEVDVGGRGGFFEGGAEAGDAEDAAAGGDDVAARVALRAGVEDGDAGDLGGVVEAGDLEAGLGRVGVAGGGQDDAAGGAGEPLDVGVAEAALARGENELEEVGLEADQEGLAP